MTGLIIKFIEDTYTLSAAIMALTTCVLTIVLLVSMLIFFLTDGIYEHEDDSRSGKPDQQNP